MNKQTDIVAASGAHRGSPALLHEMMRSFTVLARTLNLSQAVEELNSTRQTVRRHINQLEASMGLKLFDIQQRRYTLTDAGARALGPAQLLIDQGEVWYSGQFDAIGGMMRFSFEGENGIIYHQQEQPLSVLWSGKSDLLRYAIKAWTAAEGQLESDKMLALRPYILAYREIGDAWICVEVGESSFYSNWFGWAQARSSLGRDLNQFPGGRAIATLANAPFRDIRDGQGVRLDQVMTRMRFSEEKGLEYVVFDRLLCGARLPDGSPVIVSIVDRAHEIRINGVDKALIEEVPAKASVDFAL